MSFIDCIFYLLVEPLRLLFEVIFFYAYKLTHNAGLSILAMSLVINFLLLPLYFRADKLEKEQAEKKLKMSSWITRIRKTFKGDERVMILQAYYRENNYRPTDVFKESVSLFLQIPFFIAAYSFLSNMKLLHGIALGPIKDLGAPDALIPAGSWTINLLPILMTVINITAGFIYTNKGLILDKIKLVLIALVFLVLLYDSPSGLVLYWTLNNLFSLVKNIVVHCMKPKAPGERPLPARAGSDFGTIMIACAGIAVMTGLMIPSDVLVQDPTEFVNTFGGSPINPSFYLLSSALIATGMFLIWIPLFTYLTRDRSVRVLLYVLPSCAVAGVINFIAFNKNFGLLSTKLVYEYSMKYSVKEILINLLADLAVAAVIFLIVKKFRRLLKPLMVITLIAVSLLSAMRVIATCIFASSHNYTYVNTAEDISIPLSTQGRNVVVIMMDRMIGAQIPYIFNERPELQEQFDGFTFYSNTVSFGNSTNNGSPALFGGYDYTPDNLNARDNLLLVDKHNEALLMLPMIFADNGWTVTVGDAPFANYEWIPDMRIYDDHENITAYNISGALNPTSSIMMELGEEYDTRINRNLFCYGLMKTMPYLIQPLAYSSGNYNYMNFFTDSNGQVALSSDVSHSQVGINEYYMQERLVLESLDDLTDIRDSEEDCFFMMGNGTSHEICLLQEPEYAPAFFVNNEEYDAEHMDRFTLNGVRMDMSGEGCYSHYECNMSACILLGEWFDYLRENGLYDNTRIIITADHGYGIHQFEDLMMDDLDLDAEGLNPVLFVKDFGSEGFTTSDTFMTNADTPYLAVQGIVDDPVNPFTGNPVMFNTDFDYQLIYLSARANTSSNNGPRFYDPEERWLTVHDDIWERDNWMVYNGPLS